MIKHYNSIEEIVSAFRARTYTNISDAEWRQQTRADVLYRASNGDESLVARSQALLDKINEGSIEVDNKIWQGSPYGPILSVPDYLSDVPTPFRRMGHVESEFSPLRIFVSLTSSSGIGPETLRNRGIAIMALVMKLQEIRPIELIVYTENYTNDADRGAFVSLKIETQPVSLAHSVNLLSDAFFARQIMYGLSGTGIDGRWPMDYKSIGYKAVRDKALGVTEIDLVLEPSYLGDLVTVNPIQWVNETIQRMMATLE